MDKVIFHGKSSISKSTLYNKCTDYIQACIVLQDEANAHVIKEYYRGKIDAYKFIQSELQYMDLVLQTNYIGGPKK